MKTLRNRTSALLLGMSLCGLASLAAAAPTVSLSAPANAALYLAPATLAVSASVTPSAGTTIARVDFYQGSTLIGTDTTTPYSITWSNAPAGTHSLTAKATDSAGGVTTSAARSITVNATNTLPTVSLSAPPANASYLAPASVTLTASASGVEVNTPISKIEFLDGSTVLATLTGTPYTYAWANLPVGAHSLTARATDSAGGVTTSAPRTITVNASNTPPTVSLSAPANNASYTLPVSITLSASASGVEVNTPISQVEFYQGTTRVGTATATPYSVLWTPPTAGSYSLTAKATDSAGGVTTSAPRSVTIQAAAATQVYYLHTDHLNTPRLVTDETNTVLWRATPVSEPFGMGPPEEDPDGNGTPFVLNLRFPGQYFDKESNLSYNYFRDYNPQTGRYIQSDPIGLQGGINTYSYVQGNPQSFVDPDGRKVVIVGHLAAGFIGRSTNPDSYHLAIYLDPDDKCECKGSWPMTLGAQPDFRRDGTTWLVRSINNPGDALSQASFTQQITPPAGVSDCEFIKRLIAAAMAYGNNQRYSFPSIIPGFGRDGQMGAGDYNSNSFVSGTFTGAGFATPQITGQGFQTPGYSNPVPMGR